MCRNDPHTNQVIPPNKKAQQNLLNKVHSQKVRRYYKRARCLNSGEEQTLNGVYHTLDNTKLEFNRCHSADERIFKLNRRRMLEQSQRIDVKDEIEHLNERRRMSATPHTLCAAEVLSFAEPEPKIENNTGMYGTSSSLPSNNIAALHKGLPTVLSQRNLVRSQMRRRSSVQEFQTADGKVMMNSGGEILEPLRLLERIEISANQSKSRERLQTKRVSKPAVKRKGLPSYLALSITEKQNIRQQKNNVAVASVRMKHAGSDDQCSEMVRRWITDTRALF